MLGRKRLYKKSNYNIQKSINIEDGLYTKLRDIVEEVYDAKTSEVVNACIEEFIEAGNITYIPKPEGEITLYRSIMVRKENLELLNKVSSQTGISFTRLVNMAIRKFIKSFEQENK